ncbi:glycosyltransferase [Clostridium chromiireducens]|uniref:Glycosyltransferase n=1 Tax=Clostridium chromiireducens TaxID=225345 RepID=A0A964RT71_9CLOT|nr:glycosyltransferase family 4 protein [Clostridium chromiireducens]MVX67320.1 glycosyltransferase [Clostridium chromiireducens]
MGLLRTILVCIISHIMATGGNKIVKILYLTARQPYPVTKGDQMTAYEQIKELSKRHEIYLISFYTEQYDVLYSEMIKYCKKIYLIKDTKIKQVISMLKTFINFNSIQANCYYRYGVHKKVREIFEEIKPDIVHVQSFRMANYFIDNDIRKKSIDLIDAYSLNMLNRAKKSKRILKPLWYSEYYLLRRFEENILNKYKYKFIVAGRDKEYLKDQSIVVNNIGTSLDSENKKEINKKGNINIVFQGNMSYYPNVQAVKFIAEELLPSIKIVYPNVKFSIVGSNPSKNILKYESENIEFTGYVESMKHYLNAADMGIYPIFSATGIQTKVLEAMASKVPCIVSKEIALGIPELVNKKNVLIANDLKEYISCFEFILNNNDAVDSIVEEGYNLIKEKYSWERHVSVLESIWIDEVVKE